MTEVRPLDLRRGRYKGWESWHISKGPLELVLVPQVGGRLMGLRWHGHDLFFTDPALEGRVDDLEDIDDLAATKRERGFLLWGGDKTWLAPQDRWTEAVPFLDLDSGPYDLGVEDEHAELLRVRMTSRRYRESGVEISRTVEVHAERPGWTVTHSLLNASSDEVEWAPWDVAMLLRPGKVYLPRNDASSHRDGVKTFEVEGESVSVRPRVVSELDCNGGPQFTHTSWDDHRILYDILMGRRQGGREGRIVPSTVFTDPQVAGVGLSEREAQERGVDYEVTTMPFGHIARAIEMDERAGVMKVLVDPASERILGAAIVGYEAGELIHTFLMLMQAGASARAMVNAQMVHPALAEGLQTMVMKLDRFALA